MRPKGSPNKLGTLIRIAIEKSFDQVGGVKYLVRMAEQEPKAYMTLLGRVIPKELTLSDETGDKLDLVDLARRIAFALTIAEQKQSVQQSDNVH